MRKYLIGFMCGLLVASVLPCVAAVGEYVLTKANYPIVVNNAKYNDNELPVLNYSGNTYVPLKKLGDMLGVSVQWNSDKGQVDIGKVAPTPTNSPIPSSTTPTSTVSFYKEDNYNFANENGIIYIQVSSAASIVYNLNHNLRLNDHFKDEASTHAVKCLYRYDNNKILLYDIPLKILGHNEYIDYLYFRNTILPLVNKESVN